MTEAEPTVVVRAPRRVVVAPMIQIRTSAGEVEQLREGAEVDYRYDSTDVDRLQGLGLIGWRTPAPPAPVWPPGRTDQDRTGRVYVVNGNSSSMREEAVRLVPLWGETVGVNDDGDVHCQTCLSFIPVAELSPMQVDHDVEYRRMQRLGP